jgi:DNA-binding protein YbaB
MDKKRLVMGAKIVLFICKCDKMVVKVVIKSRILKNLEMLKKLYDERT